MSVGIFGDYAWQYYKLGMNVMPVQDRTPVIKGFNENWYKPRQTEEELEYLVENYGHCNGIAMICGHHGTVVDVDVNDEALMALVPRTPMKRFGSKGMGYLFRGASYNKKQPPSLPIELFGRGYVVLPPSYHPKTEGYYSWVDTTFTEIENLPEFTEVHWQILYQHCLSKGVMKAVSPYSRQGYGGDEGGRNNTLAARVWRLVKDPACNQKPLAELVDIMMDYDREKHPTNPWFEDITERKHRSPVAFATAFVHRNLLKMQKVRGEVIVAASEYVEPEIHIEASTETVKRTKSLIPKGGLMEAVHEMITAQNCYENEVLSLAGVLPLCSILGGHRIVVGKTHPNLFTLCTADSGVGKSAPQEVVKEILMTSANGASLIGFDDYASTQSIAKNLPTVRRRIDIVDECKQVFLANANKDSHLSGMDGELCKIFSASAGFLAAKAAVKEDSKRASINKPFLTLMMFSTKAAFYRYYSRMLAEEGFGGRTLFLADETNPADIKRGLIGFNDINSKKLSTEMYERVNYWLTMDIKYVNPNGVVESYSSNGGSPKCHSIKISREGQERLIQYQNAYQEKLRDCSKPGDTDYELRACYLRAIEQHFKLLGCWIVSEADENYELGVAEVEWAHDVFELSLSSLRRLLAEGSMASVADENVNRYRAWAKGKVDIDRKYFMQWVRRTVGDIKNVANFITILETEGHGYFVQEERKYPASNGKVRRKWVFTTE